MIAWTFHFPSQQLWGMEAWELDFWAAEAPKIADAQKSRD